MQQLNESEARFKAAFDSAFDPVFITEITSANKALIRSVNHAACEQYGYTEEEFKTLSIDQLDDEANRKEIPARIKKLLAGQAISFTTTHIRKDGSRFPCKVHTKIIEIAAKKYIYAQHRDISEQLAYENVLKESRDRYQDLYDHSPHMEFSLNAKTGRIIECNQTATKKLGYSRDELIGKTIFELYTPSCRQKAKATLAEFSEKGSISGVELEVIRRDDEVIPVSLSATAIRNSKGEVVKSRSVLRDISLLKMAQKALAEREAKYRLLADNTYDWEYWLSPQGDYEYISPACQRITGYAPQQFINKRSLTLDIVHPDNRKSIEKHYQREIDSPHEAFSAEFRIVKADGETRWIQHHCFPIYDENGKYLGRRGVNRDINDRKMAELEVEISRRKYENYMNMAPVLFFVLHKTGKVLFSNQKVQKVLGFRPDELLDKNIFDVCWPREERAEAKQLFSGFMKGNTKNLERFEKQVLNAKGQMIWLSFTNTLMQDEVSGEWKAAVAAEDITGKKKNLDLLRKLRQAVNHASEIIFMTDREGVFTFVNPEFSRFYGFSEEEVLHKVTPRILKSDSTPMSIHVQLWESLLRKESVSLTYKNKTKSGESVDVAGTMDPIIDEKGNIYGFLCIQRDISDRIKYEKLQQMVVNIANAAHTVKDLKAMFEVIKTELSSVLNSENLTLAFYDEEEKKITLPFINEFENQKEVKSSEVGKTFSAQVIRADKTLMFRSDEMKQMIKSGRVKLVGTLSKVWLGVPLKVENKITGLLVLQDYEDENAFDESDLHMLEFVSKQVGISIERIRIREVLKVKEEELLAQNEEYYALYEEYKAQNEELTRAKEKAEESDRLKSEFLLNMSHEVRTPLNAILGFTALIKEDDLSKADRDNYAQIVINSSNQLLMIIEQILEISRLQTHEIKPVEEPFNLNQLMLELFSEYDQLAKEKGVPLYLEKGLGDEDSVLKSDRNSLRVILMKLLDNAFKFTSSGYVKMGYTIENEQIRFYVEDTGIGIRKENWNIIFKRFSQEEKALEQKVGGLGLGLSIAQGYARLMKGEISLKSERGKGSTFFVQMPFHPVNPAVLNKSKAKHAADEPLILVVEDEEVNYQYVEILLKLFKKKMRVLHVFTGEDAVRFCQNHKDLYLVLMDLKLPEMSGYEATREIKKIRPDLPIVAQSAYSQEDEIKEALQAGCDDFITKPINKEEFFKLMSKYLEKDR